MDGPGRRLDFIRSNFGAGKLPLEGAGPRRRREEERARMPCDKEHKWLESWKIWTAVLVGTGVNCNSSQCISRQSYLNGVFLGNAGVF